MHCRGIGCLSVFVVTYSPPDFVRLERIAALVVERDHCLRRAIEAETAGNALSETRLLRRVSRLNGSIIGVIRRPMRYERDG